MPNCKHTTDTITLGYLAWHSDAEKREKKGEKQKQCPICKLWIWESNYFKKKDK